MTSLTTARALSALIVAASAVALPAAAQSVDEPVSVTVSYADLDIGHQAGAATLLHRLQTAAVQACGGAPDIRVLGEVAAFDKCRRAAVSRAVAEVHSPMLTALARTGHAIQVAGR
jgi:UrcA family protein